MKNLVVVGLGFIGFPILCLMANLKKNNKYIYNVTGIDKKNLEKKDQLFNEFSSSLSDKKLLKIVKQVQKKNRIKFSNDFRFIKKADFILVCVNFDFSKGTIKSNFDKIRELFSKISKNLKKETVIILQTTVPPGTSEKIIIPEIKKNLKKDPMYCYSYERIMPGENYFNSIVNINRCFAANNKKTLKKCEVFFKSFINTKKYPLFKNLDITSCEASKILENSFRSVNIAFIDEWTKYAHKAKINLNHIIKGIKKRNTHKNLMSPGLGVGGYCLTKDPSFIKISSNIFYDQDIKFPIIKSSMFINKNMPINSLLFVKENLKKFNKKKILVLGVAYKKNVGDIRYSPSINLINNLIKFGAEVTAHDPYYSGDLKNVVFLKKLPNFKNYDVVIFTTSHKLYSTLTEKKFNKRTSFFDLNVVLSENLVNNLKRKNIKLKVLGNE